MFLVRGGGAGITGAGRGGGGQQEGLLLNGRGEVARALDLSMAHPGGLGISQFFADAKGGLLYARAPGANVGRGTPVELTDCGAARGGGAPGGVGGGRRGAGDGGGGRGDVESGRNVCFTITIWEEPDTVPLFRIDLEARRVDTVGYFARPSRTAASYANGTGALVPVPRANGRPDSLKQVINPLQSVDDWAVLSDGTIALVRGQDYHVDWIHPDGTKSASAKLVYEWKRLTDGDKQRLVDSTRRVIDSLDAVGAALAVDGGPGVVPIGRGGTVHGVASPAAAFGYAPPPSRRMFAYEVVPVSQIADYWPPISVGATKADVDGNLWILPRTSSQSKQGELVYDVVNPERGLVKRVRLPVGRSIAAFGKGGVVYLQRGNMKDGFVLERYVVTR
jgi:hypothetical protein